VRNVSVDWPDPTLLRAHRHGAVPRLRRSVAAEAPEVVLVDTSVWIEFLRKGYGPLDDALAEGEALTHPFVIGELACGGLRAGHEVRRLVQRLPKVEEATHDEVMAMVERRRLSGSGIGWIDAHLVASALIARVPLLTLDKALANVWASVSDAR
jgi:predicted nucleic acid-binding protein